MKRILFVFGFTGLAVVSFAQQQDLFEVQEHLKKRVFPPGWNKPAEANQLTLRKAVPPTSPTFTYLASGEKLFSLPVDNMPCIIPDMAQFNRMPNASHLLVLDRGNGSIPNSAPPFSFK